ncbi:uncharacterized protein SPAPADRAFT_59697 [Spathaspora passalidarum NRRL Y-27907]|uniref:Brl1/Brr6 domain-containing protein n=1 Tax=Spathaspora passalidarum (strain NRRL Y-27907 / 11-Y1) TaxID=619300 RepID=G3AHW4_SPAPN|nr:uncharacterized protein SPAPADRAFT_59697 [Spathaspora passalidarum NRRL Y-27907]EGW34278.1 hypothetical protein SPAPADRAFT_59697 [Spathaspora passalidarum NRRL Y-27907]
MASLFHTQPLHHDIDGSLLQSLSLNDNNNQQQSILTHYDVEDDRMDIDDTEDITMLDTTIQERSEVIPEHVEPKDQHDDEVEEEEEEEEDTSFISSLLSPTMLGAKLAVKPQLLLMAPPGSSPTETKSETVDYEFNTSQMTKVDKPDLFGNSASTSAIGRNISSYSPVSDINTFLAKGDTSGHFNNPSHSTFYNNGMNQSYMMRKTFSSPTPTTVHLHNHYYFNPPKPANHETHQSSLEKLTHQQHQLQLQQAHPHKLALPVPWKSNISPSERIPYMLSSYLQLLLNFLASLYLIHLIRGLTLSIKRDITYRLNQQSTTILTSIETCRRAYIENRCHPDTIVPLLEKKCAMYERCMNQDPFNGGGNLSKITAETVAMVANSLIEPLGIKFFLMMVGFIVVVFGCNFSFGYIRAKTYYGWNNYGEQKHKTN